MKLSVRMRLVVNGKVYGSVDELPSDLRTVYEKAVAAGAAPGRPASLIEMNGRTYDSPEAMPPEVRRLYEAALASLPGHGGAPAAPDPPAAPDRLVAPASERPDPAIEPVGVSRWTMAFVVASAVLVLWYFVHLSG